MRLTEQQQQLIYSQISQILGSDVDVKLFGSRVDDSKLGGDIDLLIETSHPVDNPAWVIAQIQSSLMLQLGEQKIDVLLKAPNLSSHPIHQVAEKSGVPLCH